MQLVRRKSVWVGVLFVLAMGLVLGLRSARAVSGAPPVLWLQYATFDPLVGEPDVPAELRLNVLDGGPATYLVQFTGPVQDKWKARVRETGARLYGYIPDYAFIARMDASTAAQVQALGFVRWVGAYHPAYRLAAASAAASERLAVSVQTLPDVDLDALIVQVTAWSARVLDRAVTPLAGYMRLEVPGSRLDDLAALEGVIWVEPYFEPSLHNEVGGAQIMRAGSIRSGLGLYGSGQIVGVGDSGLDTGTLGPQMSDDFEGRIVEGQALCADVEGGRTTWSDINGHGTHVSGSVLGSGVLSGSDPAHHDYAGSWAGMAPEAQLVIQSLTYSPGSSLECIPFDLSNRLFGPAYDLGARIHTNSWGGPTGGTPLVPQFGGYNSLARAADVGTWDHQDLLVLFSAGNDGQDADANGVVDFDSLGSPGTAKNVLTVGATESLQPAIEAYWGNGGFSANPLAGDRVADNASGMAAFSGRGPTDDGRIKPDLVAPGTFIISARSHDPQAGTGWGVVNANYLYMGGTSMSTPLTAGGAALVREWLTERRGISQPSGALMKAVLVNGAVDISPGQYGTGSTQEIPGTRPNPVMGWGRVDLVESLNPPSPRQIWLEDQGSGLSTSGTAEYTLSIGSSLSAARRAYSPPTAATPHTSSTGDQEQLYVPSFQSSPPFVGSDSVGPLATAQLLQNRGFETGSWPPWQTYGSPFLTNSIKHLGTWSAHMGNRNSAKDQVWQAATIPVDATHVTVRFWYRLRTDEEFAGFDFYCYSIWNQAGTATHVSRCLDFSVAGDVDWTQESYSLTATELSAVRGQNVLVGFTLVTDSSLPSQAWVDDTALDVTTTDEPTSTPTATRTSTPTATRTGTPGTPTATATTSPVTGGPLRITLVWTDYPGQLAAAKTLVNDLNLEVIAPDGTRYYGNQGLYSGGQCLQGQWDACNNVEGVIVPNAVYGTYRVIVHGANVPQGPQPFALVASGDSIREGEDPTPTRTAVPGTSVDVHLPLVLQNHAFTSASMSELARTPTPTLWNP